MLKQILCCICVLTTLHAMVEITEQQLTTMSPQNVKKFVEEHKLDTVKVETQSTRETMREKLQDTQVDPNLVERATVQTSQTPAAPSTLHPGTESSSSGLSPAATLQEVQTGPSPAPVAPGLSKPKTFNEQVPQKSSTD